MLLRTLLALILILAGGYAILAVGLEFRPVWRSPLVEYMRRFLTPSLIQIIIGGVGVLAILIGVLLLMR